MNSPAYQSYLWQQQCLHWEITKTMQSIDRYVIEDPSSINIRTLYKRFGKLNDMLVEVNKMLHLIEYHDIPGTFRQGGSDLALPKGETVVLNVIEPDRDIHKEVRRLKK